MSEQSEGEDDLVDGLKAVEDVRKQFNIEPSRNIAFAECDIDGEYDELIAVSGIASPAGTVPVPEARRFQVFETPPGHDRAFDAEAKLLEAIAALIQSDSRGTIDLFSEFCICDSCEDVIAQFRTAFPGVELRVADGSE